MCGLRRAENKIKAFGSSIRNLALEVAGLGGAVLPMLVASAKAFGSMGDQLAKMAKRTGLSVETLDALGAEVPRQSDRYLHRSPRDGLRRMQRTIYNAGRRLSSQK